MIDNFIFKTIIIAIVFSVLASTYTLVDHYLWEQEFKKKYPDCYQQAKEQINFKKWCLTHLKNLLQLVKKCTTFKSIGK